MKRMIARCTFLGILLCAGRAQGQMTPVQDDRENHSHATFLGVTQSLTEHPAAPFAFFNSFLAPFVPNPDPEGPGSCDAAAFQVSQFFPAGISGSGTTSGSWNVLAAGTYGGLSLTSFVFRVDSTLDYQLDAWVDPGDLVGSGEFLLQARPSGATVHALQSGELHVTGRLAPGPYLIKGVSGFTTSVESFQAATYSFQFVVSRTPQPLIVGQPAGVITPCGSPAVFTVTTGPPAGTLTFQWRRNGVPLANSSHIGGATTPQLTIQDACVPDTGYYDVVVSNGVVLEPSSVARLQISGTTDAAPIAAQPRTPRIELAGPNPFSRETSFRYSLSEPGPARIAVYDLFGARVHTLADRFAAGPGVVTWDGRTETGARAPAGVYFVRLDAGARRGSCRVALLE